MPKIARDPKNPNPGEVSLMDAVDQLKKQHVDTLNLQLSQFDHPTHTLKFEVYHGRIRMVATRKGKKTSLED